VDGKIDEKCFEYLICEKKKKNKVKHIKYEKHEIQKFLLPGKISNIEAKEIFILRNRMMKTKDNYQNQFQDALCPLCDDGCTLDSQECLVTENLKYGNLFSDDVNKQLKISSIIFENCKRRKQKLRKKK
jgi:hypothetical protein